MYGGYGNNVDPEYMKYLQQQGNFQNNIGMANLGLGAAGTLFNVIGAFQQRADQKRAERAMRDRQRKMDMAAEEDRRRQEEQDRISQNQGFGGYAQSMEDRRRGPYAGYAARIGL